MPYIGAACLVESYMIRYVLKRLLSGLFIVWVISILIFSIIQLLPGDPISIMFGKTPDPEIIEITKKYYGLDRPIIVQYFSWLSKIVRGDLGYSIVSGQAVGELILPRIGNTLMLTGAGLLLSVLLAFPTGLAAAYHHNTWKDLTLSSVTLVLISIPEFWIGILYMLIFAVWLGILPTSGYVSVFTSPMGFLRIVFLPALTVASVQSAQSARMVRSTALDIMRLDYITLMKSLGVGDRRLMNRHVFKNVLIPVLTQIGLQAGALMGGVIIVERVFTYPGLALLMMRALEGRDYPLLQACIMVFSVLFVVINLIIDIMYCYINPKIRY